MTAERVEPTSTQAPIASLGVGLPLARVLASTMDKTLPAFIGQLVLQGDLFSLENMRVALLEARPALHGSPMLWRIVGMSTAQWLGAEESDRKNFAYLWLDTFGVTGSVPDMARLALLLSLGVTKDIPFHLPAAKRLAELALGEGGDVSLQLSDVLERLLRQSKAATPEENGAWLELCSISCS